MDEQASFEPRPVLPPRRAGRNRLLAFIVPAVALAGAIWVGTSRPAPDGSATASGRENVLAPASHAVIAEAPEQATPYPSTILGIDVRTLADLDAPGVANSPVMAIAAWYVPFPALGCPTSDGAMPEFVAELGVNADRQTFCDRSGLLVATPNPAGSMNVGGANDHPYGAAPVPALPVVLSPGVVAPPDLSGTSAAPAPPQVIVIGRLVQPGQQTFQATSARQMVVDRLVWADGRGQPQTTSILPKFLDRGPRTSSRTRDRMAETLIGPTGAILLETLVDPATLATIDPAAAALIADTSPRSARIWYRLTLGIDAPRAWPRWIAIDDDTGGVIGTGFVGAPTVIVVTGDGTVHAGPRLPADGTNVLAGG